MNQSRLSDYLDFGTGMRAVKGSSQAAVTPPNKGRKRREPHLQMMSSLAMIPRTGQQLPRGNDHRQTDRKVSSSREKQGQRGIYETSALQAKVSQVTQLCSQVAWAGAACEDKHLQGGQSRRAGERNC